MRRFIVTPHKKLTGTISFLASADAYDDDGRRRAGAMDIATFTITDSTAKVAVKE